MTRVDLSALLGRAVHDPEGATIGRLSDLGVRLDAPLPAVTHVVVAAHGRKRMVPVAEVRHWRSDAVVVADGLRTLDAPADVLLLARDVLDTQVVDVRGRRLARVGDVELEQDGSGLRLVAVDTGLAAVAQRLGARRVSHRLSTGRVPWTDVHLTSARGHRLQLRGTAAAVHALGPDELAHLVVRLPEHRGREVLDHVAPETAAAALRRGVRHGRRFRVMRARRRAPS